MYCSQENLKPFDPTVRESLSGKSAVREQLSSGDLHREDFAALRDRYSCRGHPFYARAYAMAPERLSGAPPFYRGDSPTREPLSYFAARPRGLVLLPPVRFLLR